MNLKISEFVCCTLYGARVNTFGLYTNMDEANLTLEEKQSIALRVVNKSSSEEIFERAYNYLLHLKSEGCSTIGVCVDLHPLYGRKVLDVMLRLKKDVADHLGMQLILIGHPLKTTEDFEMRTLYEEVASELDMFGSSLFRESKDQVALQAHLKFMFTLSTKHGNKKLQFQVDQDNKATENESWAVVKYIEENVTGTKGNVFFVYATSLSAYIMGAQKDIYQRMAKLGIGVVVCPSASLSTKMDTMEHMQPSHNAIANVPLMIECGVTVALGIGNAGDVHCPLTPTLKGEAALISIACRFHDFQAIEKICYENGKIILEI